MSTTVLIEQQQQPAPAPAPAAISAPVLAPAAAASSTAAASGRAPPPAAAASTDAQAEVNGAVQSQTQSPETQQPPPSGAALDAAADSKTAEPADTAAEAGASRLALQQPPSRDADADASADANADADADADANADADALDTTSAVAIASVNASAAAPAAAGDDSVVAAVAAVRPGATRRAQLSRTQQRLGVQLQFAEHARRKVADESHPDLPPRLRALALERDALLARAQLRDAYMRRTAAVIFAYECAEATREFELSCDRLRQDMLEEIQHEMDLLLDQRGGGSGSSGAAAARATTRKTRSTRAKGGDKDAALGGGNSSNGGSSGSGHGGSGNGSGNGSGASALDAALKVKKRAGNVFQPLEKRLAQSEVDFDLRELHALLDASKRRRMDAPDDLPTVRYHRGKLLYRERIFQDGDDVFVQPRAAGAAASGSGGTAYIAVVAAVTSTELFLLSERGKFRRVVLADLRRGAVALSALTPEQSAAVAAREDRSAARLATRS